MAATEEAVRTEILRSIGEFASKLSDAVNVSPELELRSASLAVLRGHGTLFCTT